MRSPITFMARRTVALSSLALFAMVLLWPVMARCEVDSAPLQAANNLFESGKTTEAEKAFREILAGEIDPALRGKTTFNLGLTLKKLNRLDEAMKVFASLLEQPVNDQ